MLKSESERHDRKMADRGRVHDGNDLDGPQQWFQSLPIVTRYWLAGSVVTTCAANFGALKVYSLVWHWTFVYEKFEVWRMLSSFLFVGNFSFPTLLALMLLVQFSKQYEAGGPYNTGAGGGTADYIFMLGLGMVGILLTYPFLLVYFPMYPIFSRNLVFYVLYVWSKRNPTAPANIWGFPMKAMYLPFAYVGLTVVMGNSWYDMAHGIIMGHFYYFLVDVVPIIYAKDILHTPQFLIDTFGIGDYTPPQPQPQQQQPNRFAAPGQVRPPRDPTQQQQQQQPARRYNWGSGGRALGTE